MFGLFKKKLMDVVDKFSRKTEEESIENLEQKEETNNLVIVLPGAGYTKRSPLLHFATGLFYNKGFDVLHINYSFNKQEMSSLNEKDFARDVQLTIDNALKDKVYSNYYIVAGRKLLFYN